MKEREKIGFFLTLVFLSPVEWELKRLSIGGFGGTWGLD